MCIGECVSLSRCSVSCTLYVPCDAESAKVSINFMEYQHKELLYIKRRKKTPTIQNKVCELPGYIVIRLAVSSLYLLSAQDIISYCRK